MQLPKLRPRPMSTRTCTTFRGVDRRPGASSKYSSNGWNMGWHDEMNLSSDRYPRLSVRPAREQVDEIDNNEIRTKVLGVCGSGDHVVLLDVAGNLHCNGHSVYALPPLEGEQLVWKWEHELTNQAGPYVLDPRGNGLSIFLENIPHIDDDGSATLRFVYNDMHWHFVDGTSAPDMSTFLTNELGFWSESSTRWISEGAVLTVRVWQEHPYADKFRTMVRMGAYVLIGNPETGEWRYADVVRLGAGSEMRRGTDYGPVEGAAYDNPTGTAHSLTLTLCDIDGNPYTGVVASSTEPTQHTGYWLDTSSGRKSVLREWSVVQSSWVKITSTFIKIEPLAGEPLLDGIWTGDTVHLTTGCRISEAQEVVEALNGDHYIYGGEVPSGDEGYIIVAGILPSSQMNVLITAEGLRARRTVPAMDFVVEAQNRLWGCRYSEADGINEIYASKLGDFRNWHSYQGLSTDSWTASRGTAAPFTGAVTLGGNPLFFREEWLEKIYPSSSGAHQIATYSLEGVQKGAHDSIVAIDDRLIYKSRQGICVYSGTLPTRISDEFGDWIFKNVRAARHMRKYVLSAERYPWDDDHARDVCMVYDLDTGDWHVEDGRWEGAAITWEDTLYYVYHGIIYRFAKSGNQSSNVEWFAESDEISVELPEHKWITYLRLRFSLEQGASCRVYISYDGGPWLRKGSLHGNRLHTQELGIWPRRCDHFRLRLEGIGGCELQSLSYRMERSEAGH